MQGNKPDSTLTPAKHPTNVRRLDFGAIAQLGERNTGSVEVGGSIPPGSTNSVRTTAMVMIIIGAAGAFGWLLALLQAPTQLAELLRGITENPILLLLLINLVLLLLGTFMDMAPLIIITTPIFLPMTVALGMDPVHFGIMLLLNLGIGLVTPPVGAVLFVGCAIGKIPIEQTVRTIWPFYGALLLALIAVIYIPGLSLWLPSMLN